MASIVTDLIVTIDPGANGSVVFYNQRETKAFKMPSDSSALMPLLQYYADKSRNPIVFMEKVGMFKSDDNGKQFGIVKLLANFEGLKMMLKLVKFPVILVHPKTWQSTLALNTKGLDKIQRKRFYQTHAQALYPAIRVTLANADALLILEFAKRKITSDAQWILQQLPNKQKHIL